MKRLKMIEASVAAGLILSILFSVVSFGVSCKDIRNSVLRLHILANSDSEADQAVKLVVRDKLLKSGSELFSGDVSVDNAKKYLSDNKKEIIAYINDILSENGFDYESDVYLVREYFGTRSYEEFTLPAGEYLALKVILGSGEGHNWWCVMFPPLCLPAAAENTELDLIFNKNCTQIVKSSPDYEIRFKIVEIIERLRSKI